jgi:hypothetical protein
MKNRAVTGTKKAPVHLKVSLIPVRAARIIANRGVPAGLPFGHLGRKEQQSARKAGQTAASCADRDPRGPLAPSVPSAVALATVLIVRRNLPRPQAAAAKMCEFAPVVGGKIPPS